MAPRRSSAPRIPGLAALGLLVGTTCGGDEPCGPHAWWCNGDEGRWHLRGTPVDDAVLVDFDGDGEDEAVILSGEGPKLTLARGTGVRAWRTSLELYERPVGLTALPGEVAVALSEPPQLAIFGMDGDGRPTRRRDILLSDEPFRLDSADLDGDGAPELLVAIRRSRAIAVVDPRSGKTREYPAGEDPVDLEVGDVDGDGRLDVVVVDHFGEALQVLGGAGDGTLKAPVANPASADAFYLALVDHDGDGDLDAVSRNVTVESVLFQRNDGHGRFSSPTAVPIAAAAFPNSGLVASPVSAGGLVSVSVPRDDVLATWVGKGAAWLGHMEQRQAHTRWVGDGPGDEVLVGAKNFLSRVAWQPRVSPLEVWRAQQPWAEEPQVATGDLDGDHLLDFAATTGAVLRLFHGRADRGFDLGVELELGATPRALVIADVSGDGRDDIVLADGQDVRALIADEDGQFLVGPPASAGVPARALVPLRVGPDQPRAIAVLPVGASSDEDEVMGARVLRFGADGLPTSTAAIDGLFVDALAPVDLDGDGVDEPLVLGRRDDLQVLTHLQAAGDAYAATFEHELAALLGVSPFPTQHLTAADLDGDGGPEVMFGDTQARARIDGLADGAPVATLEERPAPGHLHDLDGDGVLDAVRFDYRTLTYERGRGDGSFAEPVEQGSARGLAFALAARPDAQFDIAEIDYETAASHIVREVMRPVSSGDGFALLGAPLDLLDADLDGDGVDDLAFLAEGGITWNWGSETAPLARGDGVTFLGWSRGLGVGDLDGDGAAEILTGSIVDTIHAFRVHPRLAEVPLAFPEPRTYPIAGLAVADLDVDGHPDVLALHLGDAIRLAVAYGTTEPFAFGPWQTAVALPLQDYARFELGDVDGDGDLDALFVPSQHPPVLARNAGARAWSDPVGLYGTRARFAPVGPDRRVELVTQEGPTIYRHEDGDPEQRVPLVDDELGLLLHAADVDGDGRYDLTVTEPKATFVWLRSDDATTRVQIAEGPFAAVAYPDIDGDGRPDLVGLPPDGQSLHLRRSGQ